jgi:hypothetical protein
MEQREREPDAATDDATEDGTNADEEGRLNQEALIERRS